MSCSVCVSPCSHSTSMSSTRKHGLPGRSYFYLIGGWPTLKNDGRIVSWDEMTFPTEWKVMKFHGSSHHQPAMVCHFPFTSLPLCADQISMFFLINLADFLDPSCWYISRCYACCIPLLESQQLITSFHGQSSTKKHKIAGDDYFMSLPTVKQIHWWWLVYVIFNFDGDGENNKFIGFVFYPSSESCLGITRNSHLLFATMVWLKGQVQDGNRSWPEPNTSIFYCRGGPQLSWFMTNTGYN